MPFRKTCAVTISLLSFWLATTSMAAQQVTEGAKAPRASTLIGADVENAQGEDLGDIEDFVLDPQDGRVTYAVLSFGGFLGLGEKFFAVPWTALKAKVGEDDTYVLNVAKEKLTNAPGFDKNNWPDMANRQWGEEIHSYYGIPPYWESRTAMRQQEGQSTSPALRTGRTGDMAGTQDGDTVTATILTINESTKRLQLRTSNGETVELRAPEGLLGELQAGDRVEVVIRKQDGAKASPMGPSSHEPRSDQPGTKGKSPH
jgi:sporulation protein YlmC with PRC-barrel domain